MAVFVKIIQDTWFCKIVFMNGMIMTLYDPNIWACRWVADGCDASFQLRWHQHDYKIRFRLLSSIIS